MFLDVCLRLWSFLAQVPGAEAPIQAGATQAPVPTPAAVAQPPVPAAPVGLGLVQYLLMALYLLVCVGLIAAVSSQTSKNEGLGGMLGGGNTQSVFQGKKSLEESLSTVTNYLAVSFIVLSMVVSLVMR